MIDDQTLTRAATPADVAALADFGRRTFVDKFDHLYRPEDLEQFLEETHAPAVVAAELDNPARLYRLATNGDRIVGYCKLGLGCEWPEHARGQRPLTLKQLYTDPGQGIGGVLMDWALEQARSRDADEIQLSVYADNAGAQRFYARYGFEKVADIFFMVGTHRDDEYLFSLRLDA